MYTRRDGKDYSEFGNGRIQVLRTLNPRRPVGRPWTLHYERVPFTQEWWHRVCAEEQGQYGYDPDQVDLFTGEVQDFPLPF